MCKYIYIERERDVYIHVYNQFLYNYTCLYHVNYTRLLAVLAAPLREEVAPPAAGLGILLSLLSLLLSSLLLLLLLSLLFSLLLAVVVVVVVGVVVVLLVVLLVEVVVVVVVVVDAKKLHRLRGGGRNCANRCRKIDR